MAYEYTPDQECDFCPRFGYTSKMVSGTTINKFCVDHWKHYIKTGQLGYDNRL